MSEEKIIIRRLNTAYEATHLLAWLESDVGCKLKNRIFVGRVGYFDKGKNRIVWEEKLSRKWLIHFLNDSVLIIELDGSCWLGRAGEILQFVVN